MLLVFLRVRSFVLRAAQCNEGSIAAQAEEARTHTG